jgi:glutamyl-tRNA synthetase
MTAPPKGAGRTWSALLELARRSTPAGRYAPSPTGWQHAGNLRTALLAWLQARLAGLRFILRIEDLDRHRSRESFVAAIVEDLRWLGIDWDEGPGVGGPFAPYRQSRRADLYRLALDRLTATGHAYPCACSRRDITVARSAPHGGGGAIYPGTCRHGGATLSGPLRAWRVAVRGRTVAFDDAVAGPCRQSLADEVGDFVVARRDGAAYHLAVVVDDALMGVTTVVRGLDLLDSTARQIELAELLGLPVPDYWHVPLTVEPGGRKLSKRDRAHSLAVERDKGRSAAAVVGALAAEVGLAAPGCECTPAELLRSLTLVTLRDSLRRARAAQLTASASSVS